MNSLELRFDSRTASPPNSTRFLRALAKAPPRFSPTLGPLHLLQHNRAAAVLALIDGKDLTIGLTVRAKEEAKRAVLLTAVINRLIEHANL